MIKFVKRLSYVMCGLLIYSFIGGLTYSVHEHFYVGGDVVIWSERGKPRQIGNGSVYVGIGWPVGLPIWGGVELLKVVIYDVFTPIVNVGISAGEDLVND